MEYNVLRTFDRAITVDMETIQGWEDVSRVGVVMVGPSGDGVAADVGVGDGGLLNEPSDFSLLHVHGQPRLHWFRSVDVVPKF